MLQIPVFPKVSSDFSFSVLIENIRCDFRIMWNTKTKFWMINSYKEPETGVEVHGIKISPKYPFLFTVAPSFSGQLMCFPVGSDVESEITYHNFGTGWGLYYLTAEEFALWRSISGF